MNSSAAPAVGRCRLPFTASQWQELEQQAFVFKYLAAGVPVPPELLLPIRRSLQSMAARFYHPSMGYCCPFNGKMIDPEPGRCRRTDGKKWRCSKDAHPDSKYCERHMHRSRNRSRKPVELQNLSQLQSSSSSFSPALTATSLAPSANGLSAGSGASGGGRFPSGIPLHSPGDAGSTSSATQVAFTGSSFNQLQMDPGYCGMGSRDCRYLWEAKNEGDGNSFFSMTSASARGLEFKSSLDSSSRPMRPPVPSYSLSKSRHDSLLLESNARLQSMQGFGRVDLSSLPKQQQQQRFFDSHFNSLEPAKNPRQPFFDEWPKARGSWPDLEDERSKRTLFSTTHLSISLPMSSDFSSSSRSASGVP